MSHSQNNAQLELKLSHQMWRKKAINSKKKKKKCIGLP